MNAQELPPSHGSRSHQQYGLVSLPDRPLGTLGAKVVLASRLGLIEPAIERALNTLRKLRCPVSIRLMRPSTRWSLVIGLPLLLKLGLLSLMNSPLAPSSCCRFHWLTWIRMVAWSAAISWIVLRPMIAFMSTLALNSGL